MGTNRSAIEAVLRLFKGSWRRIGHFERQGACPTDQPYRQEIGFHGTRLLKEKRTLPEAPTYIADFLYVTVRYPRPGWRVLTPFPVKK